MKRCSKCGKEKPRSEFFKDKRAKDGLYSCCKPCFRDTSRASYQKHREKKLERQRAYYKVFPGRRAAAVKKWEEKNPENIKARARTYRDRHRDEIAEKWQAYYEANRDRLLERAAQYREQFPERRKTSRNPAKMRANNQKRRALKLEAFVQAVIESDLILRDEGRCGICGEPITGPLEIDHIVPLSRGGTHEPANCQPSHRACNRRKAARLDYAA